MNNTLFPVFLKTETAQFLIVGGGNVGLEKTETLLKQNPKINLVIVATYFHDKLKEIISQNENIISFERAFEEDDLQYKDFVIITTYLQSKSLTRISLTSLVELVDSRFTSEHVAKIIEANPTKITRCSLKGNKPGVKILEGKTIEINDDIPTEIKNSITEYKKSLLES